MPALQFADDCDATPEAGGFPAVNGPDAYNSPAATNFGQQGYRGILPGRTAQELAYGAASGDGASRFGAPGANSGSGVAISILVGLILWGALRKK